MKAGWRILAVAGILSLLGCSAPAPPPAIPPPHRLVGMWQVTGIPGERSWLRVDANTFALWVDCGVRAGEFEAFENTIVAAFVGNYSGCFEEGVEPTEQGGEWMLDVARFDLRPAGIELSDASGRRIATLKRGMRPPTDGVQEHLLEPPVLDAEDIAVLDDEHAVPPGVRPADDITGVWVPEGDETGESVIQFTKQGWVEGHDGCDEWARGRWQYAQGGRVLIAGLQFVMSESMFVEQSASLYCAQSRYDFSVIESAGVVGGLVTFFDGQGNVIASVERPNAELADLLNV